MLHGVADAAAKLTLYFGAEPGDGDVLFDRVFDFVDAEVWQVADPLLTTRAEEIEVDPAVALATVDDQPVAAAVAPHESFEPVVMLAVADASAAMQLEDLLDGLVGLLRDEGLVSPGVLDALVLDLAHVVAVGEHVVEVAERHGGGWVPAGATGPEARGGQAVQDLRCLVLARREQLEPFCDEWATGRIDGDGPDLATVRFRLADVEVAELGLADGAAVLDLLAHLVADVRTAGFGLVLVDGVEDGLDHRGLGVVAHVQDGRDDAGAHLLQVAFDEASIDAVAEDAVEVVDDDVVNVFLLLYPRDHFLEGWSLVDTCGGASWLDKLTDDVRLK